MPTWRGWLLLLIASLLVAYGGVKGVYPFLAVHRPVSAEVLVIEGWVQDYALEQGFDFYEEGNGRYFLMAGDKTQTGEEDPDLGNNGKEKVAEYRIWRITGQSGLIHKIHVPETTRDRTYRLAEEVRDWLAERDIEVRSVNVLTIGPHARRSRLLFEKAFGPGIEVGVISVRDRDYDPKFWWRYSEGVKEVVSEAAAYLYARFLFRPGRG